MDRVDIHTTSYNRGVCEFVRRGGNEVKASAATHTQKLKIWPGMIRSLAETLALHEKKKNEVLLVGISKDRGWKPPVLLQL